MAEERSCPVERGRPEASAERVALQYAGEISYMDEHVGRLIDGLRTRGILEHAVVSLTSDHGENFWEHPRCFNHGWDTYETTLRAVGLVRLPGARHAGSRIRGPVSSIDVAPTLLRVLGAAVPAGIEGQALTLDPPAEPDATRARFGQATKPWSEVETDPRWHNLLKMRCIRQGRYKLIQTPYLNAEELYDVEHDPQEQHDLLLERTAEVERILGELRPQLERWAFAAQPWPSTFEREQQDETLRRLESLGYLGGR
jgi:arylsulfatase A-like enzyme